jgi:hypothetical protein
MPSVMKACHPRICPLKSFARIMLARMSFHSCADGATAFGITLILAIASKQRSLAGARADIVRTASRILEGLMAFRGLGEPREGIGLPFLYWIVVVAVEASVEEEE